MKTFKADSMQEALARVKDEMGPNAVILKSKQASRRVLGRNRPCVEVTAALDEELFAKPAAFPAAAGKAEGNAAADHRAYDWRGRAPEAKPAPSRQPAAAVAVPARPAATLPARPPGGSPHELMDWIKTELKQVRESVEMPTRELKVLHGEIRSLLAAAGAPAAPSAPGRERPLTPALEALRARLEEIEVSPDLAGALLGELAEVLPPSQEHDAERIRARLIRLASRRLSVTGGLRMRPGKRSVHMLVGPTGAGKTTSVAKLAAREAFQHGLKVAILAADARRMGAHAHLLAFGKAAGLPVLPVFGADDARRAVKALADHDLVLVDTAGRSPERQDVWEELRAVAAAVLPDEVHLTLSCTTRLKELRRCVERYRDLGASSLLFTKLDEARELGCIFSLACGGLPLSFLCNGQGIPQDIAAATAEGAAGLVLDDLFAPAGVPDLAPV